MGMGARYAENPSTKKKKHLNQHIKECGQVWRCNDCDKTYKSKRAFKNHAKVHEEEEEATEAVATEAVAFSCEECERSFTTRYNLKRHLYNFHNEQ